MNENGKIIITQTGVMITPYYNHQNYYLEKLTSTYDSVRHRRNPVTGFFLDYENTPLCFISHLHDPKFLQAQFPKYTIEYKNPVKAMNLTYPIALNPDITPREAQTDILEKIVQNENKNQWFIYLSQGLGKTLLSVYLISYFGVKTFIMCYNKDILKQWMTTMKDKTNIDPKKILMIDTSALLYNMAIGKFPSYEYDIFMCTPGLLTSFGKKYGFEMLNVLMDKLGIGFKIFDEAHRNIANIIKINAFTSIDKTLYLSGDFGQSDKEKERLYFNIFKFVPVLSPSEELMNTLKFTVALVIQYNSNPSELDKASVYTKRGFSSYEYMKYQMRKNIFFDTLDFIMTNIEKTNNKGYKILILVNMIEHVDILYDMMNEKYGIKYNIGRYHSMVPDEEKNDCKNNCNMIISTYQSFSTGIDVSLIKYVISCSICTKIEDNQSSGRARPLPDGSDAYYFMMSDMGFPYTKKKLGTRLKYLQQTKIKDIKVIKYES